MSIDAVASSIISTLDSRSRARAKQNNCNINETKMWFFKCYVNFFEVAPAKALQTITRTDYKAMDEYN